MQASDPNSCLLSIGTSRCDIATIARESSAPYQAIDLRSRHHCTVLWSKADLNNNLSCARRPHQTSASREPSSLHRSCGPPDRCALSTHGGGRWAMAMLSGSFNVRLQQWRPTCGRLHARQQDVRLGHIALLPTDRADVPVRSVQYMCMICLCLALEPFTGLHAAIVVLPLPLLRPQFGTFCLRKGAVSKLRRSVCDGEARCAIQRQGRYDIFMCGARV